MEVTVNYDESKMFQGCSKTSYHMNDVLLEDNLSFVSNGLEMLPEVPDDDLMGHMSALGFMSHIATELVIGNEPDYKYICYPDSNGDIYGLEEKTDFMVFVATCSSIYLEERHGQQIGLKVNPEIAAACRWKLIQEYGLNH